MQTENIKNQNLQSRKKDKHTNAARKLFLKDI